ncbi:patatin-like phospholipase family protein, partial [Burkholderia pseudomallei]
MCRVSRIALFSLACRYDFRISAAIVSFVMVCGAEFFSCARAYADVRQRLSPNIPAVKPDRICKLADGEAGRPAIGLVLSGGGARGYAHLGVLKVLEANRIPVDCIAATSMGAVVGGLYATGMTAQDMQRRLSQVNLADIAFDVTERSDLPQKKREDERLYIDSLTIGFDSKG